MACPMGCDAKRVPIRRRADPEVPTLCSPEPHMAPARPASRGTPQRHHRSSALPRWPRTRCARSTPGGVTTAPRLRAGPARILRRQAFCAFATRRPAGQRDTKTLQAKTVQPSSAPPMQLAKRKSHASGGPPLRDSPGPGTRGVGHQVGADIPSRRRRKRSRPGAGGQVVQRARCSTWPPAPGPLRDKLADAAEYPLPPPVCWVEDDQARASRPGQSRS